MSAQEPLSCIAARYPAGRRVVLFQAIVLRSGGKSVKSDPLVHGHALPGDGTQNPLHLSGLADLKRKPPLPSSTKYGLRPFRRGIVLDDACFAYTP